MNIILEKIGANAKIAFQNKISNKKKNQVLNYYIKLILKNQNKILIENDYPFALVKYLDKNFDERFDFKTKEASINIKKPDWIN